MSKSDGGQRRLDHTRAEKKIAQRMFLTREQRRSLEARVSKGWTDDVPRVKMPLLGTQYTDGALVSLVKRMGGTWSGPRAPPNPKVRAMWARMDRDASGELDAVELKQGMAMAGMDASPGGLAKVFGKADADGDGRISKDEFLQYFEALEEHPPQPDLGPPNAEVFGAFLEPIVQQYLDELPATGVVVTLVKDGRIFYNGGFGSTGVKGHVKKSKARAEKEKAEQEEDERRGREKLQKAAEQAESFMTEGAAALLKGVDPDDRDAMMDALREFFEAMDEDGSGWVESGELKAGLENAGMADGEDVVSALLSRADNDGDGRITLEEFLVCFEEEDALGVSMEERIARSRNRNNRDPRLAKIRALFAQIDSEGVGVISVEELVEGVERSGLNTQEQAVKGLMIDASRNETGRVTLGEFRELVIKHFEGGTDDMTPEEKARHKRSQRKLKTIEALFEKMDEDGSGSVSSEEMTDAMIRVGLASSQQEIDDILARGDSDGDGELTFNEFMNCFAGLELEEFTPEEKMRMQKRAELTALFHQIDADDSGICTRAEMQTGLIEAGVVSTVSQVEALLSRGDDDGDGQLTLAEFIDCFDDLRETAELSPEHRLTSLFRSLDDDGGGWVDSRELYEGLQGVGVSASYDEIKELLLAGDVDGDGRLTLDEFLDCFENINLEEFFDGADLETVERAAVNDDVEREERVDQAMDMFQDMDADGSGWVSPQEVIAGMARMGMPGTSSEIRKLMQMADTDGDGKIEPDEFIEWFELQYQENRKRGVKNFLFDGTDGEQKDTVTAPEDIKDGFGESKKGDEDVSGIETLVAVGGLSRAVSAIAVLQLAEVGKVDLTVDIGRYVDPDLQIDGRGRGWGPTSWSRRDESWERGLTLEHLLCSLSGLDTKWSGVRPPNWKQIEIDGARHGRALVEEQAETDKVCRGKLLNAPRRSLS
jgi:Ca2+-binding EF-hand superfamily protein